MKVFLILIVLAFAFGCDDSRRNSKDSAAPQKVTVTNTKTTLPTKKAPSKALKKEPKTTGETRYVIQFPTSKSGQDTTVRVLPLSDYKMNLEYPASLKLDKTVAPATVAGKVISPAQPLKEAQLQFVVPVSNAKNAKTETKYKASIDFSVCNAQACEMIEKEITWTSKPGS